MTELKEQLEKALAELRKEKERKFDQTIDLIINLQKFDIKRNSINLFAPIPHKVKEKKICAFLESKPQNSLILKDFVSKESKNRKEDSLGNKNIQTITEEEFKKYTSKEELKRLIKRFDFFIAEAKLMPKVATSFGRVLGPAGKMPSPQLGIIPIANDKAIEELKEKINRSVRIKTKEPSIKIPVGKQSMGDKEIIENALTIYNSVLKAMPKDKENIKNIEIKFTMSKPQKIKLR